MATQGRRAADPLTGAKADPDEPTRVVDRLYAEPFAFDFFQAVRLLHALDPDRSRVGRGGPPSSEVVRFRSFASLSFPPSSIRDLDPPAEAGHPPVMVQSFLGLTGPNGVLPRHYTELILNLDRDQRGPERYALRDWFDLFNHRMTALFYRAWEKYRPFLDREREQARPDRPDVDPDPFTRAMLALIGLGSPSLRNRLGVIGGGPTSRGLPTPTVRPKAGIDDFALIHYAGLFASRPRSAIGLRAILLDYFGLGVEILQFRGRWLPLDPASQSRLAPGKAGKRLGVDAVIGERVWDVQGLFRVRLGPLSLEQFRAFLPDRSRASKGGGAPAFLLAHLVRLYAGPEFDFDLQLVLKAAEVPQCRLPTGRAEGPILGWDCWITSAPPDRDAEDAVFTDVDLE